jgi:4-hydroxy-3-polyprenylbenzoate decarboxylase
VVGITGASGVVYALRLIRWLADNGYRVDVVASETGRRVFEYETGTRLSADALTDKPEPLFLHDNSNLFSPLSSGSYQRDNRSRVVIVPCSMGTLGRMATASGSKLIERVADVALKEHGRLVIVPRETPLNALHLNNMLALMHTGAVILPAMPGFYQKPQTLSDIVNFMVSKILDALDVPNGLYERWNGEQG